MFVEDETYNPCQMYALKDPESTGSCRAESFDNTTTIDCQSFVYDSSLFPETLTTKLDLVRLLLDISKKVYIKKLFLGVQSRVQKKTAWYYIDARYEK